jgi:uncharacterized protein (DUF58 family)
MSTVVRHLIFISLRVGHTIHLGFKRRFTAAGLVALLGLLASAIVGLDTNQTMAYQAFTFLLSLLMISLISGLFFRARFSVRRMLPRFATVHEPLAYKIIVKNETPKKEAGLFVIESQEFEEPLPPNATSPPHYSLRRLAQIFSGKEGDNFQEGSLPILPPHGEGEVNMEITPARRGYLRLSASTISRPDPFGLCKSSVKVPSPQSVLVLPRRYPLPPIQLPGTRRYQPGGVSLAISVGDSEEFISLRDYRPGDPLRRIYWRGWAKTDKPIVKEYQGEFFVRHALILDTFQKSQADEVFEEAVSVAASFASSITTQESLLDLMFVGIEAYCFTSGRGVSQAEKMLEILASVQPCRDKPFPMLLPLVLSRAELLSGCICILLAWDNQRKELIDRLQALNIPLLVLIVRDGRTPLQVDPEYTAAVRILEIAKIKEGLAAL